MTYFLTRRGRLNSSAFRELHRAAMENWLSVAGATGRENEPLEPGHYKELGIQLMRQGLKPSVKENNDDDESLLGRAATMAALSGAITYLQNALEPSDKNLVLPLRRLFYALDDLEQGGVAPVLQRRRGVPKQLTTEQRKFRENCIRAFEYLKLSGMRPGDAQRLALDVTKAEGRRLGFEMGDHTLRNWSSKFGKSIRDDISTSATLEAWEIADPPDGQGGRRRNLKSVGERRRADIAQIKMHICYRRAEEILCALAATSNMLHSLEDSSRPSTSATQTPASGSKPHR